MDAALTSDLSCLHIIERQANLNNLREESFWLLSPRPASTLNVNYIDIQ